MRYVAIEGGLGNQMFQYAFILALRAKGYKVSPLQTAQNWEHKNGYELKRIFNIKDQTTWNILYKNFFLRKYFLLTHKAFYGKNFIFQPEATSQNHKFYYGTWQSEMYFKDISKEIIETFQFNKDLISTYTLSILEKMKNHVTVGLHVRRGDYLNKAFIDGFGKCCNLQYYQNAKIGAFCDIHQGVNIGQHGNNQFDVPTIGDNVWIGPGAKIFGKISIGSGIAIGANAVVNNDFEENNITIAGIPAKKISNSGNKYQKVQPIIHTK